MKRICTGIAAGVAVSLLLDVAILWFIGDIDIGI